MSNPKQETIGIKLLAVITVIPFIIPFAMVMGGIGMMIRGFFNWLKTGAWETLDFWSALHRFFFSERPSFEWVVPNRVLNWMLDGPGWFWLIAWGSMLMIAWMTAFIVAANYLDKAYKRWQARHDRPLITMSKRMKIALAVTALWMVGLPAVLIMNGNTTDIGGMIGVAGVIAFWGWVIVGIAQNWLDSRRAKTKSS